ncbi:hypothetical protein [Flavobacterium sp. CF136]|uniref:hypothetical protein n=1 Tax=Flavobacterium sp. (strain CF136) TaxID=1144313 RepID=UPI0002717C17|nr:hypothetical protein [Flavobacterium sp. CF136]EJL66914.1 hypothetical protein PMI10_00494 [Flavobacterium sp. CF136]
MNKKEQIQFHKKQIEFSKSMQAVAMQNYNLATQIESEATSALKMLGASLGQTRKGKNELTDEMRISLIGSLTK